MRTNKIQTYAAKKPMVNASEYRFDGSQERAVGANGELNASSKRELLNRQMEFLTASANGEVASDAVFASAEQGAKGQP